MKRKAIIVGLGNVGRGVINAIKKSSDFELLAVVRREPDKQNTEFREIKDISELKEKPDVAILCVPSLESIKTVQFYLENGINVVDSFDVHKDILPSVISLDINAKNNKKVALISGGWDPGTDSMIRAIFKIIEPDAEIFTNFGSGMSMGHSVVARSIKGVADAISITLPLGKGSHGRKVYAKLDGSLSEADVYNLMKQHKYFSADPLELIITDDVDQFRDTGHGALIEAEEGETKLEFKMRVNNPFATGQILLACARAACRINEEYSGAYTVIDVPLSFFLEGTREENIAKLV